MSFRDIDSPAAAAEYTEYLNQKWPARITVMRTIAESVSHLCVDAPKVLELCCGAGLLGHNLLQTLPNIHYIGIDQSAPLLAAATESLTLFSTRSTLIQADLNQPDWLQEAAVRDNRIHAIISMQSLHDLGGEEEVNHIYKLAFQLLPDQGLFINADLVVKPGEELPSNPGRLTIERHLSLLTKHGFKDVQCIHQDADFGCIQGIKSLR